MVRVGIEAEGEMGVPLQQELMRRDRFLVVREEEGIRIHFAYERDDDETDLPLLAMRYSYINQDVERLT
jgi:hypothetical protein